MAKELEIIEVDIDDLLPMVENPNVMKDRKFDALVKMIEQVGYDQPIKVFWNEEKKKWEITKGNHRFWALKILGYKKIKCVKGDYKNRDEAIKDLVSDNIVRGEIDPVKFTELFDKMSEKYGKEAVKEMFGFVEEAEFKRLYKEVKKALPEELRERLEEVREEIKTIDDLSLVLNKLFATYGDTLKWNYMIFSYSNWEELIYIRANKENWLKIKEIADYCQKNQKDINDVIKIEMKTE